MKNATAQAISINGNGITNQEEIKLMMKKFMLIFTLTALVLANTIAQSSMEDNREKMMFGVKVGGNLSNVYNTKGQTFQAKSKTGLALGGFLAVPLGKYVGVQPEILYSQKGFKGTGTINGNTYDITRTTNYLDIPLLIAFKPVESVTILAGPQYSFLTSRKNSFTNGNTTSQQIVAFENENLRKNTLCFTTGVDVNVKHIVVGVRGGWDLKNNNGDGTSSTPQYKNMWYQLTLGYRFYK